MLAVRAALLVATLALVACSGSVDEPDTVLDTSEERRAAGVTPEGEYMFHLAENLETAVYVGTPDDEFIAAGEAVCGNLDAGADIADVVDSAVASELDPQSAATIIAGATLYLCPEHKP